jgi:outer membrane protein assembly factor BamB
LSALVVAAAAVLIGWRVLAPAEVLASVNGPAPSMSLIRAGVTSKLSMAPLIVDDTVRVYASKRQIRADAPVHARTMYSAIWSFRRWPQQLTGVVAAGTTVLSRWSDGDVVAIDGRTGKIVWRVTGPEPADGFAGHRTGADTVWRPAGLRMAGDTVLVTGDARVDAYDVSTGTLRWTGPFCVDGFTTGGGRYVCADGAYDAASGAKVATFPAGPFTPLGCDVATSGCAGLRDGAGQGWLADKATLRRAPALDVEGSTVAGGVVFQPTAAALLAVDPVTGTVLRKSPAGTRVLGASAGRIVLLTKDLKLLQLEAGTAKGKLMFLASYGKEVRKYRVGAWQVTPKFVAIERLAPSGPDSPDTPGYYYSTETVLVAEL